MTGPADRPDDLPHDVAGAPPLDLSAALSQMSGLVLSRETVDSALELVTRLAATATAGTMGAAVTVVDERGKRSKAASNQAVEQADALQYELDEGPCLTAWATHELVRVDDTTTDARWPRWNAAVRALGVRSVLSTPLVVAGEAIGAMKVYCEHPMNYGPRDEQIMLLLADQAAILLSNSQSLQQARRLSRQLAGALASRDTIAQAVGVLLGQGAASAHDAFAGLATAARQADRPVEEIARALITTVIARSSGSSAQRGAGDEQ
jgi:transcriptional regulator with GAF, ATPase, and Fis domain